jgi:hypothetical protein
VDDLQSIPPPQSPNAATYTAGAALSDLIVGAHYLYGDQSTVLHAERQAIEPKMKADGRL